MTKPLVTAILLSWKRKPNMPRIVEALRNQTVHVEIWMINNDGMEGFGADRLIACPWNASEWARYVFASRVETEYGMFQDDDFMLGDEHYLEDALAIHSAKCPDHILGVAGRGLQPKPPHYAPDIVNRDGYAHILKGHFQLFRADIVRRVRMSRAVTSGDIHWALEAGRGKAVHWVSKELSQRLVTLDRHGVGLEFRPDHYKERERECAAWLQEQGVYA